MPEMTHGGFMAYLQRLGARIVDDERAARYDAERDEQAREDRDRRRRAQVARLPETLVSYAREVEAGGAEPSEAWRLLSEALQAAPMTSCTLFGPTGNGKTTACVRHALRQIDAGWTVQHLPAHKWENVARHEEAMDEAAKVDLLIVDQLQRLAEFPDWVTSKVRELIDARYECRATRQTLGCYELRSKGDGGRKAPETVSAAIDVMGRSVVERLGRVIVVSGTSYRRTW